MEVTIKIDGQAVSVKVSVEIYEYLDRADHKTETLSHEQRRHWDGRNFDEYIVATEGAIVYQHCIDNGNIDARFVEIPRNGSGSGGADYIFGDKRHHPTGNCFSGQPGGTSDGGGMGTWKSAGFAVLDSGYDIRIKTFAGWVKPSRIFFYKLK